MELFFPALPLLLRFVLSLLYLSCSGLCAMDAMYMTQRTTSKALLNSSSLPRRRWGSPLSPTSVSLRKALLPQLAHSNSSTMRWAYVRDHEPKWRR